MNYHQARELYFDRPHRHRYFIRRLPMRRRGITRLDLEAAVRVHLRMSITNYYKSRMATPPEEQR